MGINSPRRMIARPGGSVSPSAWLTWAWLMCVPGARVPPACAITHGSPLPYGPYPSRLKKISRRVCAYSLRRFPRQRSRTPDGRGDMPPALIFPRGEKFSRVGRGTVLADTDRNFFDPGGAAMYRASAAPACSRPNVPRFRLFLCGKSARFFAKMSAKKQAISSHFGNGTRALVPLPCAYMIPCRLDLFNSRPAISLFYSQSYILLQVSNKALPPCPSPPAAGE